jgi:hypothetical protein
MENSESSAVRQDLARTVAFRGWLLAGGHHSVRYPPVCRRYLLSHCLPSTATNAANNDISRLACRRFEVVTISAVGLFHAGGVEGSSLGAVDRLRRRKTARR